MADRRRLTKLVRSHTCGTRRLDDRIRGRRSEQRRLPRVSEREPAGPRLDPYRGAGAPPRARVPSARGILAAGSAIRVAVVGGLIDCDCGPVDGGDGRAFLPAPGAGLHCARSACVVERLVRWRPRRPSSGVRASAASDRDCAGARDANPLPVPHKGSSPCDGESRRQTRGRPISTSTRTGSDPTGVLSSPAKLTQLRPSRRIR